jgi:hypothetical protein
MPQVLEEGRSSYQGISHGLRDSKDERSAEVIVPGSNEPTQRVGGLTKPEKD